MRDQWANVEKWRLKCYRRNQEPPREAIYRQVQNPQHGEAKGADVGKRIIAPATLTGGAMATREI